jgi:hypothetical protein
MAHTLTITVDDAVYNTLKPFIEQQTLEKFLAAAIEKNLTSRQEPISSIKSFRGSLHHVDTQDIREENDRII